MLQIPVPTLQSRRASRHKTSSHGRTLGSPGITGTSSQIIGGWRAQPINRSSTRPSLWSSSTLSPRAGNRFSCFFSFLSSNSSASCARFALELFLGVFHALIEGDSVTFNQHSNDDQQHLINPPKAKLLVFFSLKGPVTRRNSPNVLTNRGKERKKATYLFNRTPPPPALQLWSFSPRGSLLFLLLVCFGPAYSPPG